MVILGQYKHYELIIDAEKYWNFIKKFKPELEIEIIKEIKLKEKENINNIKSNIRHKLREETIAKQQHWNEIASYNKVQRQWVNDGYTVLVQCKQSYNRALIALKYADYCLKHDNRYNSEKNINNNITSQADLEAQLIKEQNNDNFLSMKLKEQEQKIIALEKENQSLRERIT